jgi:hypothetical protein
MGDFPTMGPIFGIFFALAGLALAVFLGLLLYPHKKREPAPSMKSLEVREEGKTV